MNKSKLMAIITEHGETQSVLAEALGISRVTLSRKISESHTAKFTQAEISAIIKRYKLTEEQVTSIFFADWVSKKDTLLKSEKYRTNSVIHIN